LYSFFTIFFCKISIESYVATISPSDIGIHVERLTFSKCEKYWKDLSCEKKDIIE
jgi:hypothetical protein